MTALRRAIQTALNYVTPINEENDLVPTSPGNLRPYNKNEENNLLPIPTKDTMPANLHKDDGLAKYEYEQHINDKLDHHLSMHHSINKVMADFSNDSHMTNELGMKAEYHLNQAKYYHDLKKINKSDTFDRALNNSKGRSY